jgi:ribosomal-protein-alanine N-acetyltransferase
MSYSTVSTKKKAMQIAIETDRLILREVKEEDIEGLYDLDADPAVHEYLGKRPITRMEEAVETFHYIQNQHKTHGIGRWAVIEKASNAFAGWCGLKFETAVREDMDYYDLGYRLRKEFWGRGIATEAATVSLKYGFQTLGLSEIYAGAHVENIGSNKVLQKVGLKFIERFEYDHMPHNWYGITSSEWETI